MPESAELMLLRQELGAAILGRSTCDNKRAMRAFAILEDDVLSCARPEGAPLGTFPDLQRRCGVGKPAFRAAMHILGSYGLVDIRRGGKGGVFVSRPSFQRISAELSLFLSVSGARYASVIEARAAILQAACDALISRGLAPSPECIPSGDRFAFIEQLAALSTNPVLYFFARLVAALHRRCSSPASPADAWAGWPELARALLRAIECGDRAGAASISHAYACLDEPDPTTPVASLVSVDTSDMFNRDGLASGLAARLLRDVLAGEIKSVPRLDTLDSLAERYECSESAIRQAIRMIEEIGFVRCHRGRTGGIGPAPGEQRAIVRSISYFLATSAAGVEDSLEVAGLLHRCAVRLLGERPPSACADAGLEQPVPCLSGKPDIASFASQMAAENVLLEIIDSPALAVFSRSLALHHLRLRPGERNPSHGLDHLPGANAMYSSISDALRRGEMRTAAHLWSKKAELIARARHLAS